MMPSWNNSVMIDAPSEVANARQDFAAEQIQGVQHRTKVAAAGIGQRQVQHARTHFLPALPDLFDDPVRAAAETDRQYAADVGLGFLAGDVAGEVGLNQCLLQ